MSSKGRGRNRVWNRRKLKKQLVRDLLPEQEGICPLCDGSLLDGRRFNIDHIMPIGRGGDPRARHNKQLTHERCNTLKGDMTMQEWSDRKVMAAAQ